MLWRTSLQYSSDKLVLSATDLANHLACHHLTSLNQRLAKGELAKPYRDDSFLKRIIERGLAHEAAYVEFLKETEKSIVEIAFGDSEADEKTKQAMRDGADVIVQGSLTDGTWTGRPDLLLRVDRASPTLGDWSYEVADTKLTRTTKAGTILQLSLYSDLLSGLQGLKPELMTVVMPGEPFTVETHRVDDFGAYYRLVKRQLLKALETEGGETYPEPVPHCEVCRWWKNCDAVRRDDDHLSFIAGITKRQTRELNRQAVTKLAEFAQSPQPLVEPPKTGSVDSFSKIHEQAKLQHQFRQSGQLEYRFLLQEPRRGFAKLPEPTSGDVFFDIEGDRHAYGRGLEYLLGYCLEENGTPVYSSIWAFNPKEEKEAFERFVDFLIDRWAMYPEMHIYHYAHYEPTAMKRLAMQYATREDEVDRLLRAERFVDLYSVVRQGLQASVSRYSIKNLEPFYDFERDTKLEDARRALREIERELDLGSLDVIDDENRAVVEGYNKDDCVSTFHLRNWLEKLRDELIESGEAVPRPELLDGSASDAIQERTDESARLYNLLVAGLPEEGRNEEQQAKWLLAHLLDYFRREDKCIWWEFFRMHELEPTDLLHEKTGIAGLTFVSEVPGGPRDRNPTHQYKFPTQEAHFSTGAVLVEVGGDEIGTVSNFDLRSGIVEIKKKGSTVDVHPQNVFVFDRIRPDPLPESLMQFADEVVQRGISTDSRSDLLSKKPPRLRTLTMPHDAASTLDAAVDLATVLDGSILPVQGPPGAGKTYLGSNVICKLVERGFRVGVTAISHKVIANLLSGVVEHSVGKVRVAQKMSKYPDDFPVDIARIKKNDKLIDALDDGVVIGGTAWLWANTVMAQQLDYLVIDEAGQMSLAIALAATRSCRNVILLGDPQQLEQPQLGSHPEGADVAALSHLLQGRHTIEDDRGLFLADTWRLHPDICKFTSELYYDGRLSSRPGLENQLVFGTVLPKSGTCLIDVEHEGNQSQSEEEVTVIKDLIENVTSGSHTWTDAEGTSHPVTLDDILIVAPYNAQVALLQNSLPDSARVGTVDKFQGQEATIVIYSATSSSVEEAPRGMSFLFNPNRQNVATSRARCLAIVVASPQLFTAECRSPEQIRLANGFCRFRELAENLES